MKPLNWQLPNAGELQFRAISAPSFTENSEETSAGDLLELYTYRPKTKESFTIVFESIYSSLDIHGTDHTQIIVHGDEYDLQDYLLKNPAILEPGLKIFSREYETVVGKIDLVGRDVYNHNVYIEVKKGNITQADVFQIVRYRDTIQRTSKDMINLRAILVGAGISDKLRYFLLQQNIEFIKVQWNDIFPSLARTRPKPLHEFF